MLQSSQDPTAESSHAHGPIECGAADRVLGIDRLGRLYFDKRPITRESLAAVLRSSYASSSADRILYIRADRDVDYGVVEDAMELARESGAVVVGMISELQPSKRGAR